jgi:peptidoglycan/xylan/chitin deacetylase (PgdA/CDA1 family)
MKAITLLYHDVIESARSGESGFTSADAEIYKLSPDDFKRHLDAIATTGNVPDCTISDVMQKGCGPPIPVLLTFDDGGASALSTADMLDGRGWKGHFFITTGRIGTSGFLDTAGIRELAARGHVVGSHSCSHPARISHLDDVLLSREWSASVQALEEILGATVDTASVPGGFYSTRVAEFARQAGIRVLFNSEPSVRVVRNGDFAICGRFGLQRDSPPERARLFAMRDRATLAREAAFWNAKKLLKRAGGEQWLAFRRWWLAR